MICPNCKSENIKHEKITDNNGVCGPGFNSWIIIEYYVCQECGVMFKNVKKQEGVYDRLLIRDWRGTTSKLTAVSMAVSDSYMQ